MAVVWGPQKLVVVVAMLVLSVMVAPAASPQDTDLAPTELANGADSGGGVDAIPGFYAVDSFPLGEPRGLDVDPVTGLIWSTDVATNSIQIFDHAGNIVDSFGGLGSADGQFDTPGGIAIAGSEVFVADFGNDRVQVFDKSGNHLRTSASASSIFLAESRSSTIKSSSARTKLSM
jgi:DNA-binding beta-propeller fold protein YncE